MEIGETILSGDKFYLSGGRQMYSFCASVGEVFTKDFKLDCGVKPVLVITQRQNNARGPLTEQVTLSEKYKWTISRNKEGQLILTPIAKP